MIYHTSVAMLMGNKYVHAKGSSCKARMLLIFTVVTSIPLPAVTNITVSHTNCPHNVATKWSLQVIYIHPVLNNALGYKSVLMQKSQIINNLQQTLRFLWMLLSVCLVLCVHNSRK